MNCIGIDLGGMSIKTGLVRNGAIISEVTAPTQAALGPEGIMTIMATTAFQVLQDSGLTIDDIKAIGVGAGIILKGTIWNGLGGAGSEFGHMVIRQGGRLCSCGRQGCFETYASATGLFITVRELMTQHPDSSLHHLVSTEGLHGYTPFVAATEDDDCAKAIVARYVDDLACGITNIINGLYPDVICLGGGIARQGEALLEPLRHVVKSQVYGGSNHPTPAIIACTLGNKAGIIGAATMAAQRMASQPR